MSRSESHRTPPFQLRMREEVREHDETEVRRIVASTGFFSDPEIEVATELVRERVQRGPESGYRFLFAETHGPSPATVGYACYGEIACTVGSFDLYWIAVDADHRGAGIGRWLLAQTEDRVRSLGGRMLVIETSGRDQYTPTQSFYARAGYRLVARLEDFYAEGDPKLVYTKRL